MRKKWVARWNQEGMRHTFYFTCSSNQTVAQFMLGLHLKSLGCSMPEALTLEEHVQPVKVWRRLEEWPAPDEEGILWISPTPS